MLNELFKLLAENKEWLFSGIGCLVVSIFLNSCYKRIGIRHKSKKIKIVQDAKGNNNVQIGQLLIQNYTLPESERLYLVNKVKEFQAKLDQIGEYTWISEDKKTSFTIDESGLCKQRGFFILEPGIPISITFPHPFINEDFDFFLESSGLSLEHLTKTTTGVSFIIGRKYPPELLLQNIRWVAIGVCG